MVRGVFCSTNNRSSWTAASNGLTDRLTLDLAIVGTRLFAATCGGVFCSTDEGAGWVALRDELSRWEVHALAITGTSRLAGTQGSVVRRSSPNRAAPFAGRFNGPQGLV